MKQHHLYLLCDGDNCQLRQCCKRYLIRQHVDNQFLMVTVMQQCDVEARDGFVYHSSNNQL